MRTFDSNRPVESFKELLRNLVRGYQFDIEGLYRKDGTILPLPRESSVVGKVVETSIGDYLNRRLLQLTDLEVIRASSDRTYPDFTFSGSMLYPYRFALDVKCARIDPGKKRTESAITIGTFDAEYFRHPNEKAPNIMAPYSSYSAHLALIALYKYEGATAREVELLVVEKWRVATKKRSSGTRCYIAASPNIANLRAEREIFESEEDFNVYWRSQAMDSRKEDRWKAKRAGAAARAAAPPSEPLGLFGD